MAEGQDETEQDEKDTTYRLKTRNNHSESPTSQRMRREQASGSIKHGNLVANNDSKNDEDEAKYNGEEENEEEDVEDEPHLKYTRVTGRLGVVYRNADATSAVSISGDKMIIGTHNGTIHALSLPSFQSLRYYRAHSASVTAISLWPSLSSFPMSRLEPVERKSTYPPTAPSKQSTHNKPVLGSPRPSVFGTAISSGLGPTYIATASIDGHVCVSSLSDPKDVVLRNFARPVQAVALSPEYKNDRSYLSGGLAGQLILTVGGRPGVSTNANTTSPAAAASNWLSSVGLTASNGKDSILHSGEGAISTIKWSLSGKYVVWVNEQGIKIMRSNIRLTGYETELAWKRIGHVAKPPRPIWEEMGGVWKARVSWIDEKRLQPDKDEDEDKDRAMRDEEDPVNRASTTSDSQQFDKSKHSMDKRPKERLIIGWGDTVWILQIQHSGKGTGKDVGEHLVGTAEIIHMLRFDDCIISGISQYSKTKLLVLAYGSHADDDDDGNEEHGARRGSDVRQAGVKGRRNGVSPELRMIDIVTKDEVEVDALTVTKYESLSAADYHLNTLYVPEPELVPVVQRGAFDALSGGLRDAGVSAGRILSSGASVVSFPTSSENMKSSPSQTQGSSANTGTVAVKDDKVVVSLSTAGLKIFIHSPYDCILAVARDLADRLEWYLKHENYKDAWKLVDKHPETIASAPSVTRGSSSPSVSSKAQDSLADFFANDEDQKTLLDTRSPDSAVEKEKRRIGDLWLKQLVAVNDWQTAGQVAGKVLGTSSGWEHWVWKFAQANKFDEIAPYIPTTQLYPRLPSLVYEVVLGHYIHHDAVQLKELLDRWDTELFHISSVTAAIEDKLSSGDVRPEPIEGGEKGRDWRIFMELLARLFIADHHPRQALRCYIRLKYAEEALSLIREYQLLHAIADDIPGFLMLRVSMDQIQDKSLKELEEASTESVQILADEAYQGAVKPDVVVSQLQKAGPKFQPFLYFYLATLWRGESSKRLPPKRHQQQVAEGRALVDYFGDLAVDVFAEYDRSLLLEFLRLSQSYSLEHASAVCEKREYIPELVYVLSATGQIKSALSLIISSLGDVSYAISFAKEQADDDLWNDLLKYSMDKPRFIRALLEEVGTSINPVKLVSRIPEGLEIEGLPEGIRRMMRDYEIQSSISEGAAKVLRSDVAAGMELLRAGQRRGVRFEVVPGGKRDGYASSTAGKTEAEDAKFKVQPLSSPAAAHPPPPPPEAIRPGHCIICGKRFLQDERDILVGFACGHVQHLGCLVNADVYKHDRDGTGNNNSSDDSSRNAENTKRLYAQLRSSMDGSGNANTAYGSGSDSASGVRSVGAKVAHAHVVGSFVRAGCRICRSKEDGDMY